MQQLYIVNILDHMTTVRVLQVGNIGVELNLAVGKINRVLSNFILPTLNKKLYVLTLIEAHKVFNKMCPLHKLLRSKVSVDLGYKGFVAMSVKLDELRCCHDYKNCCVTCSVIPKTDSVITSL